MVLVWERDLSTGLRALPEGSANFRNVSMPRAKALAESIRLLASEQAHGATTLYAYYCKVVVPGAGLEPAAFGCLRHR